MKIIFLGTNGWYDTETGNTLCVLIESKDCYIVLDAGNGFSKSDEYIKNDKPVYIFLSHFHLDHIIGLHTLAKFEFKQKLTVFGQKGTIDILSLILNKPFTMPLKDLPYEVDILEVPDQADKLPFKITVLPLVHSDPCLGIRIEIDDKIIVFCTDTGYCQNAVKLAHNADLLITECSLQSEKQLKGWPHLYPEAAARIAAEAESKMLALTHFESRIYTSLEDRKNAEQTAKKVFSNSIAAHDGLEIKF